MSKANFNRSGGNSRVTAFYSDPGLPTTGDVYYVNSVTGTDSTGYGRSPDNPYASIAFAVANCTASNGDVVYVMPLHVETVIAAAGVTFTKAGVSVRGMGTGRSRPVVNYTTAIAASFDIGSANCSVDNIVFTPIGFDAITAAVNISAAGVSITNCEFELANATNQAVLGILTTAAANRLLIQNCWFHGTVDAGTTAAITIVGGTDIRILDSNFIGAYTLGIGAINQITTTTVNCLVGRNTINNLTASSTKAMVFTASSTGQIFGNGLQVLSGTAPITGAAMSWVGSPANYYAATIATGSTIV